MKLRIAGYDVEIKAKADFENRFNKGDTEAFLNHLSLLLGNHEDDSYLGSEAKKASNEIYDTLDELGVYDKFRNG